MPYLMIQTNAPIEKEARGALLQRASRLLAERLGKPERYVMVALESTPDMLFAGDPAPLAYLELKSIGLPEAHTRELSQALCGLMQEALGIAQDRVYIEFASASGKLWGWNGGTF